MCGLMDTTGFSQATPIGIPFAETSAALYAAAAIMATRCTPTQQALTQTIEVSLYSCAVNALSTFLPKAFVGTRASRMGNLHPSASPWNTYRTEDGWVLICTGSDDQWRKLADLINVAPADRAGLDKVVERVAAVQRVDGLVEGWTSHHSTAECVAACDGIGIAAGPILQVSHLADEPNFQLRHAEVAQQITQQGISHDSYRGVRIFQIVGLHSEASPSGMPAPTSTPDVGTTANSSMTGPLAGLRVIEIGQYTTAPLAAKHLAALGAEVLKVEPLEGEASRAWTPAIDGTSFFFALNNTDKTPIALNLKDVADRDHFAALVAEADVLIENLRPGALAKLGFGREALSRLNGRLVYCSISGFGIRSAYPARPAFDTVIQAMGGIMDRTRTIENDFPVKTGVSASDILGGQVALFAVILALVQRQDRGQFVEVAMQDVAAWATLYTAGNPETPGQVHVDADGSTWTTSDPRTGRRSVPVTGVEALLQDPDFQMDVLTMASDPNGTLWPVLKPPYRLSHTPARVSSVPGHAQPPVSRRNARK
ncbi:hypothetical protein GCM10027287_39810 [Bordetella muralis]